MGIKTYFKRAVKYIISGQPENHITVNVKVTAPNDTLKDKRIIVTGGSRGLGYSIAERCIKEGAYVLITGRDEKRLKESSKALGENCTYICFDAQRVSEIPQFLENCIEKFGGEKINCLVSNAGVSLHEPSFREVTEDGWDLQMDTNLKGNFFLVKEFVTYLEKQEDTTGNVVVITSERAQRADDIPYGLTKVASNSFVKAMARKVIGKGIRINAVAPGVTTSDMTGFKRDENMYVEWQAAKRLFVPEEVAEVVNFLLGDASNCISGEVITCNHGRHISLW